MPTAVLVSGAGTNLGALLDAAERPGFPARIALVVSNRPSAGALSIAREHGVEAVAMPVSGFGGDAAARDLAMRDLLLRRGVRLVVCAGYDRVLDRRLLEAFPDAILNLHPSLLPAFGGGMHAVEEALEAGVRVSGCTVHLLAPGAPDGGPIVLQAAVPVLDGDDAARLRARIHEQEWRVLPEAVTLWCEGRLRRVGRRVRILPAAVGQPGR
ncbi:MAG TPA: phosphoribosylglycinamide formyltransferase [Candidatus Dormibacteraeota bacterium]|jgi:phosphoribosylglycinamide formyltransferase-1|nr:phosphoribosylglycinamide formyltransferase [Candidatus Dormibacteraeota bacterium]